MRNYIQWEGKESLIISNVFLILYKFYTFFRSKEELEKEGEKFHNVYERNKNEMKLIRAWINVKF